MRSEDKEPTPPEQPAATDEQHTMRRARPAIVIYPPERDGDRDTLIAALAAAVVAIARERAQSATESSLDAPTIHRPTVKSA